MAALNYTYDLVPVITAISPRSGFHNKPGAEKLTITGSNFGPGMSPVSTWEVTVGGQICTNLNYTNFTVPNNTLVMNHSTSSYSWSNSSVSVDQLVCDIPKHPGGYADIKFRTGSGYASSESDLMWFKFESAVQDIYPPEGSRYGGQIVTISGYGFEADEVCEGEENVVVNLTMFDHFTPPPVNPEIVEYCYRNYSMTFNNRSYFTMMCDDFGNR